MSKKPPPRPVELRRVEDPPRPVETQLPNAWPPPEPAWLKQAGKGKKPGPHAGTKPKPKSEQLPIRQRMILAILRRLYSGDGFLDESPGVLHQQIGNRAAGAKESPWEAECKRLGVDYKVVPSLDTVARAVQAAREGRG